MVKMAAFVTGGGGYVGRLLCQELVQHGYSVTAYDLAFPESANDRSEIISVRGDITNGPALEEAVRQSRASVVFHMASYGMSGREQLNKLKIEAVNIEGTKNVLKACVSCGVGAVVYTSTYNVVFGGQEIVEGREEDLPYFPLDQHVDNYSRTKAIAEQEVLSANGTPLLTAPRGRGREKGEELKTCALRCAGIYGEGEARHLPRIVSCIESGLFQFTYGPKDSLVDFLHGENFVQAHIRAAHALQQPNSPVAGEAYFISDGKPINNFEFFRPLCEGLGYSYPQLHLPLSLVFYTAFVIEMVHSVVSRYVCNFQPFLTRAEVFKTGVTHYFSLEKARRDFNYDPQPRDLTGVVKWFRERGRGRSFQKYSGTGVNAWQHYILAVFILCLSSYVLWYQ